MKSFPRGWAAALALGGLLSATVAATEVASPSFKVCAPPYNLPMSDQATPGYENRIAELFASEMGAKATYTWFPQRLGFIRATLKNNETEDGEYKCDFVMGVVENFELAATTQPYMRSTWAMVYVKGQGLDWLQSRQDLETATEARKSQLKIGIWDQGPTTDWVSSLGLIEQTVPFPIMSGDPKQSPAHIVEDELLKGNVNLTFLWGPIAGYVQQKLPQANLVVIPLESTDAFKFDYQIAMAVRHGDKQRLAQLSQLIRKHQGEIDKILRQYNVPLLPLKPARKDDDD